MKYTPQLTPKELSEHLLRKHENNSESKGWMYKTGINCITAKCIGSSHTAYLNREGRV